MKLLQRNHHENLINSSKIKLIWPKDRTTIGVFVDFSVDSQILSKYRPAHTNRRPAQWEHVFLMNFHSVSLNFCVFYTSGFTVDCDFRWNCRDFLRFQNRNPFWGCLRIENALYVLGFCQKHVISGTSFRLIKSVISDKKHRKPKKYHS